MVEVARQQQWRLPRPIDGIPLDRIALPQPLRAVLYRRGFSTTEDVEALLSDQDPPAPHDHFPQLAPALARLQTACRTGESLAVCGDYDADGMTSTALLLRAFRCLGANPKAAIPSRMDDGYGLNPGMVEQLHAEGIRLLITVDNGVAAREALERAADLGTDREAEAILAIFGAAENISIDYGIMEGAPNVGVVLGDFGWSDLGTWGSLYDKLDKDADGNALSGVTFMGEDAKGLMVAAEGGKLVVAKGLQDFIVVDTPDALLLCPRSEEQWVKQLVSRLKTDHGEPLV